MRAFVLALIALMPAAVGAQERRSAPWTDDIVELAESLPVQDGGRVKPLHTYAGFTLLRLNGKRSMKTPSGARLAPVEWLLDTLFFPRAAADYRVFLVQNDAVITAMGLPLDRKKRDRYAFNELRPGIDRLFELAREYTFLEQAERSSVQEQVVALANNVDDFMLLAGHLDFARVRLRVDGNERVKRLFGAARDAPFHTLLERAGELRTLAEGVADRDVAMGLLRTAADLAGASGALALIPPTTDAPDWLTPDDLFQRAYEGERIAPEQLELLRAFEALAAARDEPAVFGRELSLLHGRVKGLAEARGEYDLIGLELAYYKSRILTWSLYLFVLAFLGVAFLWLRPRARLLYGATSAVVGAATLLLVAGITMRCLIRGRPPVSTLYETVLFVTAVGAIVALFVEAVNRQRIAISAAAILGVVGMFIANGYEMLDKRDTMPSLVAVLDTNFWLATHVTAITIGYSAGMLAALLASLYLLAKLVGFKQGEAAISGGLGPSVESPVRCPAPSGQRAFYRTLGRMVYGVLCFAMIFSIVGTILGGVWANDSWGRFWGWDPKENGALLIVIAQIAILHGRMGGYLREHGVCMAAAFGGTVIAFSWWGVNLLGVGLHSYGFTSGIHSALWTYYGVQWAVVGLGGIAWLLERRARASHDPPAETLATPAARRAA